MSAPSESSASFACFGSTCAALVIGRGPHGSAEEAVAAVERRLLAWHERFSRFLPDSEISALNRDPRSQVPASAMMLALAQAVHRAGEQTGGLVDGTMLDELESAGYVGDLRGSLALGRALALAPARRPAGPSRQARWREIEVDLARRTITRPQRVKLDGGGLAKGLFADVLARELAPYGGFAINCAGDLAIGGADAIRRPVNVESPFDGSTIHTFQVRRGGVATSGIGRRSWLDGGVPRHHLLDPASGEPAFTGIVQVTALAPSALLAEIRAKAAILSGPGSASRWLPDGGVVVLDDGSHRVIEPPPLVTLGELARFRDPAELVRAGTPPGPGELAAPQAAMPAFS
ncbi:MAG TPA: FAD:protein FMN transferase [Solirubrobacteraceae bacterium]|jgi:thiamine biosynthesis lipoprotein